MREADIILLFVGEGESRQIEVELDSLLVPNKLQSVLFLKKGSK